MKKLILTIAFFTLIAAYFAQAFAIQPEASVEQETTDRIWQYVDRSTAATGKFIVAREGKIFIEQEDEVISVGIEELSWTDQKYVSQTLKEQEVTNSRLVLPRPMYAGIPLGANTLMALATILFIAGASLYLRKHPTVA